MYILDPEKHNTTTRTILPLDYYFSSKFKLTDDDLLQHVYSFTKDKIK